MQTLKTSFLLNTRQLIKYYVNRNLLCNNKYYIIMTCYVK